MRSLAMPIVRVLERLVAAPVEFLKPRGRGQGEGGRHTPSTDGMVNSLELLGAA